MLFFRLFAVVNKCKIIKWLDSNQHFACFVFFIKLVMSSNVYDLLRISSIFNINFSLSNYFLLYLVAASPKQWVTDSDVALTNHWSNVISHNHASLGFWFDQLETLEAIWQTILVCNLTIRFILFCYLIFFHNRRKRFIIVLCLACLLLFYLVPFLFRSLFPPKHLTKEGISTVIIICMNFKLTLPQFVFLVKI